MLFSENFTKTVNYHIHVPYKGIGRYKGTGTFANTKRQSFGHLIVIQRKIARQDRNGAFSQTFV